MSKRVRLRYQRLAAELARSRRSQNAWAQKLDISPAYLSQMLNGRRIYPGSKIQQKLVRGLGIPFDELFSVESSETDPLGPKRAGTARRKPVFQWEGRRFQVRITRNEIHESDEARKESVMSSLILDLRFALRSLFKQRGFTLASILTLSLGIGVNTAIFSFVDRVFLAPLPYPEPQKLVSIWNQWTDHPKAAVSQPQYFADFSNQPDFLQDVGIYRLTDLNITGKEGPPERIKVAVVSPSFLTTLGVTPRAGQLLPSEFQEPTAMLAEGFWKRRFGGDPQVIGKSILLHSETTRVVGIMRENFQFPVAGIQAWVALDPGNAYHAQRGLHNFYMVGRLAGTISLDVAREKLSALEGSLRTRYPAAYPPESGWGLYLEPLREQVTGPARGPALALLGAVSFVLLIACANVANLLLARATTRRGEMSLRSALGATRGRIARQLLTETILLGLAGGAGGLVLAWTVLQLIQDRLPEFLSSVGSLEMTPGVFVQALLLSLATGCLFGLAPLFQALETPAHWALRVTPESGLSARRIGLRGLLVVLEVALSMALLAGAGLLMRSFLALQSTDPGFEPEGVLMGRVSLPEERYPDASSTSSFHQQVLAALQGAAGIESAGLVSVHPLSGSGWDWGIRLQGDSPRRTPSPSAQFRGASPEYFRTLAIPLLEGRGILPTDREDSEKVIVVSKSFAEHYWAGRDPIGRQVDLQGRGEPVWRRVVGLVGDVRQTGLDEEVVPTMYLPFTQTPDYTQRDMTYVLKSQVDPSSLAAELRSAVSSQDPQLPLYSVGPMSGLIDFQVSGRRFNLLVVGSFAFLATLLAVVGLYGVIAYMVSQRTRETGIRLAMGADRSDITWMVVREGMQVVLLGLLAGLLISLLLARLLENLLYQVSGLDPLTHVAVTLILSAAAMAAIYIPARRASRLDPVTALHYE